MPTSESRIPITGRRSGLPRPSSASAYTGSLLQPPQTGLRQPQANSNTNTTTTPPQPIAFRSSALQRDNSQSPVAYRHGPHLNLKDNNTPTSPLRPASSFIDKSSLSLPFRNSPTSIKASPSPPKGYFNDRHVQSCVPNVSSSPSSRVRPASANITRGFDEFRDVQQKPSRHSYHYSNAWNEDDQQRVFTRDGREIVRDTSRERNVFDTASAFSRQLARITQCSDSTEDISDLNATYRVNSSKSLCWESSSSSSSSDIPSPLSKSCVGKYVLVGGVEEGILRYYGRTAFAEGEWCGIELAKGLGKNDGSVDGVIYFTCQPQYGIFAPAGKVSLAPNQPCEDNISSRLRGAVSEEQKSCQAISGFSCQSQPSRVTRRPSDASNATYTIESHESSLQTSPETSLEPFQTRSKPKPFLPLECRDVNQDDDVVSLGSPEDATCDESSLGILRPEQMPDFTVNASASLGRSPSDEDVADIEDEICDPPGACGISHRVPMLRWDSSQSVDELPDLPDELLQHDISNIIRELRTSAEVSSSGGSSPTIPRNTESYDVFDEERDRKPENKLIERIKEVKVEVRKKVCIMVEPSVSAVRGVPVGVDVSRLPEIAKRAAPLTTQMIMANAIPGEMSNDVEHSWPAGTGGVDMTTSAGSLDQGYQGDAECDPRSECGTGTASSPTEDRGYQGVIDMDQLDLENNPTINEADDSFDDDDEEESGDVTRRDRTARIIDGRLYRNNQEIGRVPTNDPHTSEMESSGFYSDLDPKDRDIEDESTRTDLEPVQEAQVSSQLHDSLLDDNTTNDMTIDEDKTEDQDFLDDNKDLDNDDEDRSNASTLRPPSKELTPNECQDSTTPETQTTDEIGLLGITDLGPKTSFKNTIEEEIANNNRLTDSGISVEGVEDISKSMPSASSTPKPAPRTYDKPWLSRPPQPKKEDKPKKVLPPPPPMPRKNVQSKLKALIESSETATEAAEKRPPRQPKKNRWDDVMNKISDGQKDGERTQPRTKEVKSRLMESLKQPVQLSPQAERIRQERREQRERREKQKEAQAAAARRAVTERRERKRSSASIRSNRTSRAPSMDSLRGDGSRASTPDHSQASYRSARASLRSNVEKLAASSRPMSPCNSDISTSSGQSHASNMSRVSTRLPIRSLHASGPARAGSVTSLREKRSDTGPTTTTPRRTRDQIDLRKVSAPAKIQRSQQRKTQDPVKAARATNNNNNNNNTGRLGSHGGTAGAGGDQLRRLEAEVAARAAEVLEARQERDNAALGLEALTVLLNHLTNNYDAFATPRLKAEVVRLNDSLTETRLSLDETVVAVGRLQEEASEKEAEHSRTVEALQQTHKERLDALKKQQSNDLQLALEKQRRDLSQYAEEQQTQREALSRAHKAELEQMEGEWRTKLDIEHEKHLRAVGELNTKHTKKLRELESSRMARERELEITNDRLAQERDRLVQQTKSLEESLLNDTDHRLQAVRKLCSSLGSEVDSLKTVVEMRNNEIHDLRNQVVEKERLSEDLESARLLTRTLQAKTEDLKAQMDTKAQTERQIINEHRMLIETYQRENNINKRLSLENEELQWKLRQRDELHSMSTSMPSSTLDLMTRSPAPSPRRHEGGAQSPQVTPRSPRVNVRSGKASPARCEMKHRSRLGLSPDINGEHRGRSRSGSGSSEQEMLSLESPPQSPCVKAVIEKSNSVSFILDLNESHDESYSSLDTHHLPSSPSPRSRPTRTASFGSGDNRPRTPLNNRRVIQNNHANSAGKIIGVHTSSPKIEINMNGKSCKDINGKAKETNGKGLSGRSGRTFSESSEYGSEISNEIERVSPTGLSWNIPVHNTPKSPSKSLSAHRQNSSSPSRGPPENRLLEDPEEDEYEESGHQFIEVVELGGGIVALSSSDGASDSEISQCDIIKGDESSSDSDSDSSDSGHGGQASSHGSLAHKTGPWLPKNGAGEAMIADDILVRQCGGNDPLNIEGSIKAGQGKSGGKRITRRRLSSAPSTDSEDNNPTPVAMDAGAIDGSWSEDVDVTSSSEINEIC